MSNPLKILASAYACGPNWGSEIGMGWNWVLAISNHCELSVITELGFKEGIEEKISKLDVKYIPKFHYIDVGEKGRELFWKQGSASFYSHYKEWQKNAFVLAESLLTDTDFDVIHQLNMIGYREPGYLWKLKEVPYVFGPVGGYNQFPVSFMSILGVRDKLFYAVRNTINTLQMYLLKRPHKAYKRAEYVILATPSGEKIVSKYTKHKPIVLSETGAHRMSVKSNKSQTPLKKFIWIGLIAGRKALPIALKAISKSKNRTKFTLDILGEGPNIESCKALANKLGLTNVKFHGNVPNTEAKKMVASSDMLFFTSLLDATSTVVFEALQSNTPVLCHDTCGFGNVIDDTCGIKIPVVNVATSVKLFSKKIDEVIENPEKLVAMQTGCSKKVEEYFWEEKGKAMFDIYKRCL